MALSCIVCEIYRLICRKSRNFYTLSVFSALAAAGGEPRRNFVKMFDAGKTRMIGPPYGEKNYFNMLSRFHPIPERHGRTDRQTDGQTDRIAISISRVRYRYYRFHIYKVGQKGSHTVWLLISLKRPNWIMRSLAHNRSFLFGMDLSTLFSSIKGRHLANKNHLVSSSTNNTLLLDIKR